MQNENYMDDQLVDADSVQAKMKRLFDQAYKIEVEVMESGKLPSKAHFNDAGFDVFATEDIALYPGQILKHPLNIKMKLPVGSWARIETKSGLGSKGMLVYAGVVDEGYRGMPHVIATNMKLTNDDLTQNLEPILIKKGQKLAQITMNPHSNNFFIEQVKKVSEETDRGAGGFGSSGL